ncbi:MAG: beta-mannosidase [Lewinellaceae bacterium]|nr:beta-mannosidase [Phaeodactylibacter sp.]MCB9041599.1 beta-mannosidase [Lewinellaceae bacterium]
MRILILLLLPLSLAGAAGQGNAPPDESGGFPEQFKTVDPGATKKTKALYANLREISSGHILFGHQDDLAYGVGWKEWPETRSDVKDVCGRYPAVFGWDLGKLGKGDKNIDTVRFAFMRNWMLEAYKMGGINTVSWHLDNFVTNGNSWDVGENVVSAILPGGAQHEAYKARLDVLAGFFKSLRKGFIFKHDIPIVFRPFHEHTGHWFWWGQPHCTPEEYKELWRFTVEYLRDEKEVHNLLYCYSTDVFQDEEHYLQCYPGDEYVDILGFDDYRDVRPENDPSELTRQLRLLVNMAEERGKVAALTETGLESIPEEKWWTGRLLGHIKADPVATRIAWVLVWRNARPGHHYAPYPGHVSVPDFMEFCKDPLILMEGELPKMYKLNSKEMRKRELSMRQKVLTAKP